METEQQGNSPEIGMQADSFEEAAANQKQDDSSGFFSALEDQVNGAIQDETPEVTHQVPRGPEQATHNNIPDGSNNVDLPPTDSVDWKKRYEDSSREAVRLQERYKKVEPFVPVLEAMKEDSGLVEHVRDYLVNGGAPSKNIQEQLGLDEDFVFDQSEAMQNPDSDSAKLMNAYMDKMVQKRVDGLIQHEKTAAVENQKKMKQKQDQIEFMKRNNMSPEQFQAFMGEAKKHVLTLDDINYLLNRDKVAANVAQATKQDQLNQMRQVRSMPTSASGANSQAPPVSVDDNLFDGILGLDDGIDNLFGD